MAAPVDIPGYDQLERVGMGASGTVYRARQLAFEDRLVAVKVIPDTDVDERTAQRFRRECLAAGKLSWHPNVVSVYDAGVTDDGLAYLVMEYLAQGSLAERLRKTGAIPWHKAVDLTIQVAGALAAAHAEGLVHRDLKPENILIGPFGEPKLGDFGIAFIEGRSRSRTGSISGTIAHSAPETLAGNATESADIYALGSTLYTLLVGQPAFVDASDHSITPLINRIATADVPDLRPRGVPDSLADVIEGSMAKMPEDRWSSAQEFGEALQEVQRGEGQTTTRLLVASDVLSPAPLTPARTATAERVAQARGDNRSTVKLKPHDVVVQSPSTSDTPARKPDDAHATVTLDGDPSLATAVPGTGSVADTPDEPAKSPARGGAGGNNLADLTAPSPNPALPKWPGPPIPRITPRRALPSSSTTRSRQGRERTGLKVGLLVLAVLLIAAVVSAGVGVGPFNRDTADGPTIAVGPMEENHFATVHGAGFPPNQPLTLRHCGLVNGRDTVDCGGNFPRHVTPTFDGEFATTVHVGRCLAHDRDGEEDIITAISPDFFFSFPVNEKVSFHCR